MHSQIYISSLYPLIANGTPLKIIKNKIFFFATYKTAEMALMASEHINKTICNVHDLYRDFSDDYKIYYSKKMIEQIRRHENNYEFVYDVFASIMKICELPENSIVIKCKGKKIIILLHNPYFTKDARSEIDEKNIWDLMFKKRISCPNCGAYYGVNYGTTITKECINCGKTVKLSAAIQREIEQCLPGFKNE
jgi:hypothetical protein